MYRKPPIVYRGSVKNVLGPLKIKNTRAFVFEYTDDFSVFDWGKMPNPIPQKGHALAILAAWFFEKLNTPGNWKNFFQTQTAKLLIEHSPFQPELKKEISALKTKGLRNHYLGVLQNTKSILLDKLITPTRSIIVESVEVKRPAHGVLLGRTLYDYSQTQETGKPKLIPLEVVFRFGCPEGSSLLERLNKNPCFFEESGFPNYKPNEHWSFPFLELFTKLESKDRPLYLSEALAISGLSIKQLKDIFIKTSLVAGFLKEEFLSLGLELMDGKLEWATDHNQKLMLVDAVGIDELRILKDGTQLSKEFLRVFYRQTQWFQNLQIAKQEAIKQGQANWKKLVSLKPPELPHDKLELASQIYQVLTNELTKRPWFQDVWTLDVLVQKLREAQAQ
ncbi:MAG: hypothetical protein HY072_09660 [Deltaproteobacteria bacterium]|nr:hypothetical protein [Deltaproteobacteria bacterium]